MINKLIINKYFKINLQYTNIKIIHINNINYANYMLHHSMTNINIIHYIHYKILNTLLITQNNLLIINIKT